MEAAIKNIGQISEFFRKGGGKWPMWTVQNAIVTIIIKSKITIRRLKKIENHNKVSENQGGRGAGVCQPFRHNSEIWI